MRPARGVALRDWRPPALFDPAAEARRFEPLVTSAAIFLAPWRLVHPPDVNFTASDVLFCFSLLLLAAGRRLPRAPHGDLGLLWLAGITLLTSGLLVSSIVWGDVPAGLVVIGQYMFSWFLLSFVLVGREPATLRLFIKVWLFAIVTIDAFAIASFLTGFDMVEDRSSPWRLVSGSGRLQSVLGDPNACASMVALTLPFLFYLWLTGGLRGLVALSLLALLGTTAVMTSSVNGLASTLFGVTLFVMATLNRRVLLGLLATAGAGVAWVTIWGTEVLPLAFQRRVLGALLDADLEKAGTFSDRLILLREAVQTIDRSPLAGVGADRFQEFTSSGLPVHNMYLLVWAEGGLVALIGWLLLLAMPPIAAVVAYRATRLRFAGAATFTVGAVFALIAVNSPHMYARFWLVPFHLAVALSIASVREGRDAVAAADPSATGPGPSGRRGVPAPGGPPGGATRIGSTVARKTDTLSA